MKIDTHTHILPRDWPDLRERYGYGGWIRLVHREDGLADMMQDERFFRTIEPNCWDAATRLAQCDGWGIDVQVLSTVPVMFGYWAEAEHAHDLAQLLNDDIAKMVAAHPRRFVGLGSVPLQSAELSAQELERCVRELGFPGVQIGSHIGEVNLDHPSLTPFWEKADELAAAIMVHPWDMMGRDTMPDYWLPWLVGMPAETARAICSVLMGGIVERYPRVRIMFAHGGGAFPFTLGRINHGFAVRPDLCQTRTQTPPGDLIDRIWLDSIVHDEDALHFVLGRFGAERIMLGSDYPFPLGELEPGRLIGTATLDDATRDALLAETALSWLGLDRSYFERDA